MVIVTLCKTSVFLCKPETFISFKNTSPRLCSFLKCESETHAVNIVRYYHRRNIMVQRLEMSDITSANV